ncbi:MAG: hypothetical protein M3Q13_09520 [Pseudomonadota bacterium]|nr:hypothetical protein [Pseudomonadota bacterium]
MDTKQDPKVARLMPLLVIGIILNTLGIVFTSLGNIRFALIGVGLALMLTFIVKAIAARKA